MKNWLRTYAIPLIGPLLLLFVALVLPLTVFGHIADEVRDGDTLDFDEAILNDLHAYSTPARDAFFVQVAKWGGFYGLVPLTFIITAYLGFTHQRTRALFFGLSVFGACLINVTAKAFFGRARPALWLSPAPEKDFSFPSGHAMLSTAFFVAIIILMWRTKWRLLTLFYGLFFIGLIVFSRLYLGVHYPTDIIGGIFASLTWVGGLAWVMHNRQHLKSARDRWRVYWQNRHSLQV